MFIALQHHLQHNHFPPIHEIFIPVAEEAIEKANAGEWDDIVTFPEDAAVESLPVWQIVQELHLDYFIDNEED